MVLSGIFSKLLIGDRPRLEFDQPKVSQDGRWLLSGRMIVEFAPGPNIPVEDKDCVNAKGLIIAIPFSDAADEKEAVRQAATALRQVGSEIELIARLLLGERQRNQKKNHPI